MKVLIPYPEETVNIIRTILGDEATVVRSERTVESMLSIGGDADIIATGRVPAEYIRSAKSLKLIHGFGAGIDKIDRDAVLERSDIIVCNSHINAAEVAEYAIMLLLSLAKRIIISDSDMRRGDWRMAWGGPLPNYEIRKKTCLIVGLGNIGTEVAKRIRSFDVTIHAATRSGTSPHSNLVDRLVNDGHAHFLTKDFHRFGVLHSAPPKLKMEVGNIAFAAPRIPTILRSPSPLFLESF